MTLRFTLAASAASLLLLPVLAAAQGGIFVTGHDPDYHAVQGSNTLGARHIIQDALAYTTNRPSNSIGSILLVTDTRNPGGDESDSRLGMTAAGYTFTVADDGTAGGSVLDLNTVNFANYNAVVIASDYGGWLRESELSILNNRSGDILNYINGGGGLVAFAESDTNQPTSNQFGFLPFLATSAPKNQSEVGDLVTPFGASLGLNAGDINGNASHNIYTKTGGMTVVDTDANGEILSLGFRGTIGSGGVNSTPEPSSVTVFALAILGLGGLVLSAKRTKHSA